MQEECFFLYLWQVFQRARAGAPALIFLDEIDSIIGKRSDGTSQRGVQERVLSTLLNEMDGIGIRLDEKTDSMGIGEVTQGEIIDNTLSLGFLGFEHVTNPYLYLQIHPKIIHDFLSQRIR